MLNQKLAACQAATRSVKPQSRQQTTQNKASGRTTTATLQAVQTTSYTANAGLHDQATAFPATLQPTGTSHQPAWCLQRKVCHPAPPSKMLLLLHKPLLADMVSIAPACCEPHIQYIVYKSKTHTIKPSGSTTVLPRHSRIMPSQHTSNRTCSLLATLPAARAADSTGGCGSTT
jgi:hypothetical protein